MLTRLFQCPACAGRLREAESSLSCDRCGETIPFVDGIADLVRGRFDTALSVEDYDASHAIVANSSDAQYDQIRLAAGDRWPASLGTVLEIGCGTGLFSRAMVRRGETGDLLLTDVSVGMLRACRDHIAADIAAFPRRVSFATYSSHEACLRDVSIDTCIGASALHHIPDARSFLADIFRALKPGGRAFFGEPNQRHVRALGQTLADVLACFDPDDPTFADDRQLLLNLISSSRQSLLHQDDLGFLAALEDKHVFLSEAFEDMALDIGYATAEALPLSTDTGGARTARRLCGEIGTTLAFAERIEAMVREIGPRYFDLLDRRDASQTFLLWATKATGPAIRVFHAGDGRPPAPSPTLPDIVVVGGAGWRAHLTLVVARTEAGLTLTVDGWCLMATDIRWLRVVVGGHVAEAAVWYPRPDVHRALNHAGAYPHWNAICCGINATLPLDPRAMTDDEADLSVAVVLSHGAVIPVPTPDRIRCAETVEIKA